MLSLIVEATLLLVVLVLSAHYVRRRMKSLPPGPIGIPILGNMLDMPTHDEAQTIAGWSKKYGDMIFVTIAGTPFLYLNGAKETMDLLDKRSALYSECDMGGLVPLTGYGDRFKLERRLMNQALSARAVEKWEPLVAEETNMMLKRILDAPERFIPHLRRMAGSLIFTSIYGYRVTSDDDPYVKAAEEFMSVSSHAILNGWLVDFLPFLRHVPGLTIHKKAAEWKIKMEEWVEKPHAMFKATLADNPDDNSFCRTLLFPEDGHPIDAETEERIKWVATSMYGAGSDTTVASLSQFILAMILHPEVQKKAQNEVDAVVGRDRLPTLDDRARLPYVECVLKECLRWGTPVPLTIPHRLSQVDEYNGHILPEGTLCVANIWAMLHDERIYPEPHRFYPERYEGKMDAEQTRLLDPSTYIFGFGRRRCPGIHFANPSVWLGMVSLLSTFTFTPSLDKKGREIIPPAKFISGTFRHPEPFKCRITPRHEGVPALIEQVQPAF
uniref:Cytochrome P450 monooxygenase claT n=1 Tax=Ampulloclitocybe clavipes TaxID=56467 RepID=CLAT_AMPCV